MNEIVDRLSGLSPAKRKLLARALLGDEARPPVAIVGVGCRLPGARSPEEFWRLVIEARTGVTEVPASRWDADRFYAAEETPGKMTTRWGGFVDDVDRFDPAFFGIAPREAERMDPQQRLLLEVAWEAMENGLTPPSRLAETRTGVYVGIGGTDYSKIPSQYADYYQRIDAHVGTGNALSIAANRISYLFNLRGPSLAVDTACSSGLIAVHLAVESLRRGESDAALAGAVNLILSPETSIAFSKARMLSPDGVCRPFDGDANGYVRGEGCGMLLLKRLEDAERDNDPVLAVIRGSAANQDGRTSGITAPNGESQKQLIREALNDAGLTLDDVSYLEAHGTGTPLGDPIEAQALAGLFRRTGEDQPPCHFASVKGNIGHTETVSGVAGLIKTALMMQHGVIPPQANFTRLNPHIDLSGTRLSLAEEPTPWVPVNGRRVAGVSSFGFGGANVHVVVEAPPASAEAPTAAPSQTPARPKTLLPLSARSEEALAQLAKSYAERLDATPDADLAAIAETAAIGREAFAFRAGVVASSHDDLLEALRAVAAGSAVGNVASGRVDQAKRPRVAFVFTGQGSQQPGMGRGLYEHEPVFRAVIDRCDELLRPRLDAPLVDVLYGEAGSRLDDTTYTQPALFSVQHALTELWKSWGVTPAAVLGHSVGEYAAACAAGVLPLEEALRLIAERGALIGRLPSGGRMASLIADGPSISARLAAAGNGSLSIAAFNGPASTVVSGEAGAVEALVESLTSDGVVSQMLNVSHAFHSPLMEPVLSEFHGVAKELEYGKPAASFFSTLLGAKIEDGELNADYWRDHIRQPVRFEEGFRLLLKEQPDAVVEIGPAPQLLGMARRFADADTTKWLPSLRPGVDDHGVLLRSLGDLFASGATVDWRGFFENTPDGSFELPTYPFQRTRLWLDEGDEPSAAATLGGGPVVHELLGRRAPLAGDATVYESSLSADSPAGLRDHQVQDSVVVPAAAILELALAAGRESFGEDPFEVRDLSIEEAIFLPDEGKVRLQTHVVDRAGAFGVTVYTAVAEDERQVTWKRHATAELVPVDQQPPGADLPSGDVIDHRSREEFYALMDARGLNYGPTFQVLGAVERGVRHAVAEVQLAESVAKQLGAAVLPPALGDACLQLAGAVTPLEPDGSYCPSTYMPIRVEGFRLVGDPRDATRIAAHRTAPDSDAPRPDSFTAELSLLGPQGELVAEFRGARFQRVDRAASAQDELLARCPYRVEWTPAPNAPRIDGSLGPTGADGAWLIVADAAGVGGALGEELARRGGSVTQVNPDAAATAVAAKSFRGIVDLSALDSSSEGPDDALCAHELSLLQSIVGSATGTPAVSVVTSAGQKVTSDDDVHPASSALWGLGRVAANEHAELRIRLIDLQRDCPASEAALSLVVELLASDGDSQVAIRGGERYVARLRHAPDALKPTVDTGPLAPPPGPYGVKLAEAGSFDGLTIGARQRVPPPPGHVEIQVGATGLNFSDVLKALGLYPGLGEGEVPIGIECAGTVTAVGQGVDRFRVGETVMGVAPGCFASHVVTAEHALIAKPAGLADEDAATLPITFLTAYHALVRLGQLSANERLLIHAGAGGVGLAAIQIAQLRGAEIFATAGSPEKQDYLRSLGVEHVYDSRSLDFATAIRRDTGGEGVDVVLNSLPGDAIRASLGLLRAYGRFLEIGKTDIYADRQLGLAPFQDNLSYFAIDLDRMLRQRPAAIRELFAEVGELFESAQLKPLPATVFDLEQTRDAFRYMAQRKNIGKVVVRARGDSDAVQSLPEQSTGDETRPFEGAWLITGGQGALGLRVADWLAAKGAPTVGLLSRREPSGAVAAAVDRLADRGCRAIPLQGDVLDPPSLASAIDQLKAAGRPLTGVVHAAGVLDDGVLHAMTAEKLDRAMAPKTRGAWNLHLATADEPVGEFLLFSSIASQLGSPGQANYAAGNAFLDGLAHWRRGRGLPARSINWGPWAESGMAAAEERESAISGRGVELLPPAGALAALDRLLATDTTQLSVLLPRWDQMLAGAPRVPSLLKEVAAEGQGAKAASAVDEALRGRLIALETDDREAALREFFLEELAKIMGLSSDQISPTQPLSSIGLDSLMAIELKNNVESRLGVVLPMARFMEGPSVTDLSAQVAQLLGEGASSAAPPMPTRGQDDERAPLSHGQQALWFLHQLAPQSTAYNLADAVRVSGPLDLAALRAAIGDLVARHGAFRTTFHNDQGRPYQTIHATRPTPLEVVDAEAWSDEDVRQRIAAEVHAPFDLEHGPLFRVVVLRRTAEAHVLLFAVHHIIADFWSLVACTDEFRQLYAGHATGAPVELPPLPLEYGDFTRWQQQLLAGPQGAAHLAYWQERLDGDLPALSLPTDRPRPPVQTFNGALAFRWLDEELTARLKQLAENRGATLNMLLLAAYELLLHRYAGQDELVIGLPTSGRSRAEFSPIVGYFVNPVAVRAELGQDPTFGELLDETRRRTLEALEHQDLPLPLLVDELHVERDPSRSALFQALFVMQKAQVMHDEGLTPFLMGESGAAMELAGLQFESMTLDQWVAQFDVSLAASEARGGVSLGLQYNTDLFDASTIESMLDAYERIVREAVAQPDDRISALRVLSRDDAQRLEDWNATTRPPLDEAPLVERIARQAATTPDAPAVSDGSRRLSYRELNESANQLAAYLGARGVGRGDRVGLCLGRGVDLMVGLLGTLKTGAAYAPLDPTYPKQRLDTVLQAAGLSSVVTVAQHLDLLVDSPAPVVALDAARAEIAAMPTIDVHPDVSPDDLIYVIFTSGSTGQPKGAGVKHRGFANLIDWYVEELQLGADDAALVITSPGFDLTQKNFFAPLTVGGQVHLSTSETYDPSDVRRQVQAQGVTLLNCTPSSFYPLVDDRSTDNFESLASLRHVVLGGEPIDAARLRAWIDSGTAAAVLNSYGPTECSDVVAWHRLTAADLEGSRPIPIGAPIRNARAHVLNSHLTEAPIGSVGELCLGGDCLGVGYVNDAALTAERFVTTPAGEPVYRTGDLCRRRPDGLVEFVGRADHQVKIRGFRIELGDIEQALVDHPAVSEAVVVIDRPQGAAARLVGYAAVAPATGLAAGDLRAALAERLPSHMVPAAMVLLPELPRTPHGKLERRKLPQPAEVEGGAAGGSPPKGEREELLAEVWQDVLHVEQVGRSDNFFDLGGDSLRTVEVVARLAAAGWRTTPAQLLRHQTIAELAPTLATAVQTRPEREPTGRAPLTPAQRWFLEGPVEPKSHFNQSLLLEVPPGIDRAALERATHALGQTHEALRLRLEQTPGDWRQEVTAESRVAFHFIDLTAIEPAHRADEQDRRMAELQQGCDLSNGPLGAVAYFGNGAESPGRLLLTLHHLVTDAFSTRLLLEDLLAAYEMALAGGDVALPAPPTSFREWGAWLEGQDSVANDLADGAAMVPGDAGGANTVAERATIDLHWDAEETRRLLDGERPPSVTLLAALAEACRDAAADTPWLVDVERLGRPSLGVSEPDPSRTVGWLVTLPPIALEARSDAAATVQAIQEQWDAAPAQGVGWRPLPADERPLVRFNYLGAMQQARREAAELFRPLDLGGVGDQPTNAERTHVWELDFAIRDDQLTLAWTYSSARHSEDQMAELVRRLLTAVRELTG